MNLKYQKVCAEIAKTEKKIEDLQAQLIAAGDELSQLPDKLFQDLGSILKEQVTTPGDIRMTFTSEKEEPVMDLVNTLFMEPGSVPLRFSSTPGAKTLTDSVPKTWAIWP